MRIHFIAIGGSAMHNLALALHDAGHIVSGSDDEIYEPSRSRLMQEGLLPEQFGWYTDKIEPNIDAVILGMHARADNPELLEAQRLGLKIYSYPEFVAAQSVNKKRVVIAGSHGKTTTTSIIMHVLSAANIAYDYLVGAQLDGFDRMVKLSDAGLIILEGDEYLSSPIDRRPKMMHYRPDISVITGVAWDHINVFPTFEDYVDQFRTYIQSMTKGSELYFYKEDEHIQTILGEDKHACSAKSYTQIVLDQNQKVTVEGKSYQVNLIGNHNLQNIKAAEEVCVSLGVSLHEFYGALETFRGAHKRLETLKEGVNNGGFVFLDFAHAPSKVKATTHAIKDWYPNTELVAIFELHTYSSLNKDFIPQYEGALDGADQGIVFFSEHALKMKKMPMLESEFIHRSFAHKNLSVISDKKTLKSCLQKLELSEKNLLLMTSGNFDKLDVKEILDI